MGNILNLVYDEWDEYVPIPNLITVSGIKKFRVLTGLFCFYNIFDKAKNCRLEEVYSNPDQNYYYMINPIGSSYYIFQELGTLPLPESVEKCMLECKNFNIVFINEHEFETKKYIEYVDQFSEKKGFNRNNIYIINNNSKLETYKNELNTPINVYSLDFLVTFIAKHLAVYDSKYVPDNKEFFFMCHNRSPKPHRYMMLVLLKKYEILDDVDWSLIMGWCSNIFGNKYAEFISPDVQSEYQNEIDFFDSIRIKKSKYEEESNWFTDEDLPGHFNWADVYELKTYENSYVNIVTESNYTYDEIHITEKSLKPFYFYQLPIFVGSRNHIKFLKSRFGFDMFDDIINHSYDDIEDNRERMTAVFNEIKRLHENKEQIIEFYKNNKERLEKNKQIVIEISKSQNDQNYFLNLINK
jgi:hypothetical protein